MMFLKKTIFFNVSLETLKICPLTSTLIRVSVIYLANPSLSIASSKTSSSACSFLSKVEFVEDVPNMKSVEDLPMENLNGVVGRLVGLKPLFSKNFRLDPPFLLFAFSPKDVIIVTCCVV